MGGSIGVHIRECLWEFEDPPEGFTCDQSLVVPPERP